MTFVLSVTAGNGTECLAGRLEWGWPSVARRDEVSGFCGDAGPGDVPPAEPEQADRRCPRAAVRWSRTMISLRVLMPSRCSIGLSGEEADRRVQGYDLASELMGKLISAAC